MKKQLIAACTACCLMALPVMAVDQAGSGSTDIDFGSWKAPENGAFVEIKVNSSLINMAARIAEESEPEIARILGGLRSIRINVIEFNEKGRKDVTSRVKSIRKQLDTTIWEQVVSVKEENEDVGIYVNLNGEESIEGVVVTVIDEGEAVIIHVDGSIRPEEIAQVGERLNLEPLKQLEGVMDHHQDQTD